MGFGCLSLVQDTIPDCRQAIKRLFCGCVSFFCPNSSCLSLLLSNQSRINSSMFVACGPLDSTACPSNRADKKAPCLYRRGTALLTMSTSVSVWSASQDGRGTRAGNDRGGGFLQGCCRALRDVRGQPVSCAPAGRDSFAAGLPGRRGPLWRDAAPGPWARRVS